MDAFTYDYGAFDTRKRRREELDLPIPYSFQHNNIMDESREQFPVEYENVENWARGDVFNWGNELVALFEDFVLNLKDLQYRNEINGSWLLNLKKDMIRDLVGDSEQRITMFLAVLRSLPVLSKSSKNNYTRHAGDELPLALLTINPGNKMKCPHSKCKGKERWYSATGPLRVHYTGHTGIRWKCKKCIKSFGWKSNLTRHMKVHRLPVARLARNQKYGTPAPPGTPPPPDTPPPPCTPPPAAFRPTYFPPQIYGASQICPTRPSDVERTVYRNICSDDDISNMMGDFHLRDPAEKYVAPVRSRYRSLTTEERLEELLESLKTEERSEEQLGDPNGESSKQPNDAMFDTEESSYMESETNSGNDVKDDSVSQSNQWSHCEAETRTTESNALGNSDVANGGGKNHEVDLTDTDAKNIWKRLTGIIKIK